MCRGAVAYATTANSVAGANVSGTVASANNSSYLGGVAAAGYLQTSATINAANVSGTFSSVSASGNISGANLVATSYHIRSIGTSISAAGSTQGTATALTKEINVVSTVASGANGVQLPAVAGAVIYITNTSANTLNVYPGSGGAINSLSTNVAFTMPGNGATLQFIAPTTSQWYTVSATYS